MSNLKENPVKEETHSAKGEECWAEKENSSMVEIRSSGDENSARDENSVRGENSAPGGENNVTLSAIFLGKNGAPFEAEIVNDRRLIWTGSSGKIISIEVERVLVVNKRLKKMPSGPRGVLGDLKDFFHVGNGPGSVVANVMELQYVKNYERLLRPKKAYFFGSLDVIHLWIEKIRGLIEELHRCRHLTIFINPRSGNSTAPKVYRKIAKPLFDLVGMELEVTTTKDENTALRAIEELNLMTTNGVICVSGDGMLSEVVNALVKKLGKDANLSMSSLNLVLPPIPTVFGIIPAGSTDAVAYSMYGTNDPTTAVLHIICGKVTNIDLCYMQTESTFIRSFIGLATYGFLGDVVGYSESVRWAGRHRYDYAGLRAFFGNRNYYASIVLNETPLRKEYEGRPCCVKDCDVCDKPASETEEPERLMCVSDESFVIVAASISCACERSPNGLAPMVHASDGHMQLIIVKRISFFNKLRLFLTLSSSNTLVNHLPFVEIYRTRSFHFAPEHSDGTKVPLSERSTWNCDGEVLSEKTGIRVCCQQKLLPLFRNADLLALKREARKG